MDVEPLGHEPVGDLADSQMWAVGQAWDPVVAKCRFAAATSVEMQDVVFFLKPPVGAQPKHYSVGRRVRERVTQSRSAILE